MLTYTFSRREKMMILGLVIVLLALAWYMLVFQRTTDEINRIESEISTTQSEITVASTKVTKMNAMQKAIDEYKAAGVDATPMPHFNNLTALMSELNAVLAATDTYTLSFDALDTKTSNEYVLRGVRADFGCGSLADAEAIIGTLANGSYPCSIDSVAITDGTAGASRARRSSTVSSSVHITYFEKK